MTVASSPALDREAERRIEASSGRWLAVVLAAVLAVLGVLLRPLIPVDETRYLTVAWEMRLSHDWLVPHLNGLAYSHKPPMLFWLINLAWSLFGENSLVARLVPAAFLPLTVWLTSVLGGRIGGRAVGNRSALICVSFVIFSLMSTLVMFDAMLSAACVTALIGLVMAAEGRAWRGFALFGAMVGAGLLIKGPAALIHVLPAALLAPLWAQPKANWARYYLGVLAALALGAAIALAWALPAARAGGPQFGQMILWGQTAGRMVKAFDHARPIWFFAAAAPALLLPWTLSRNLWSAIFHRQARGQGGARIERLPWIASAGTFILFSLVSGKQIHYLAPAMPSVAIGLAVLISRRSKAASEYGFAILVAACGVGMVAAGPLKLVHDSASAHAFAIGGAVALVTSLGVWMLRRFPAMAAAATSAALFLGFNLTALLGGIASENSMWLLPRLSQDRPLAFVGTYAGEFGYLAHRTSPVDVLEPKDAAAWAMSHPGGLIIYPYRGQSQISGAPAELRPYKKGMLGVWAAASPWPEPVDAPASR